MYQAKRWLVRLFRLRVFIFSLVRGARRTEPTFVVTFVDCLPPFGRLRLGRLAPKLTHTLGVKRVSGAHEDVVTTMLRVQTKG